MINAIPRILLVEDSATVRLVHTTLLTAAGYAVDAVADGQEGVALAKTRTYHLIIAGRETRGLRGADLVAAVRAGSGSEQPPCIITQSAEPTTAEAALSLLSYVTS